LYGIFIFIVGLGLLVLVIMRLGRGDNKGGVDRERNFDYSAKGTYGTAGFMTDTEFTEVLELHGSARTAQGTILGRLNGKIVCLPVESKMNRNVAVYGASGTMKSRAYARNMIFQCARRGESLFVTDPKSELYEDMSAWLRNQGYTVRVFNLVNPEHSDSWNCLGEIEGNEIMAQVFSDVVIKNTGSTKGDHFWDNAELNLLKALVLYVEQGYPPESKNMGEVYKLLTLKSERELNALFDLLPLTHPAKAPFAIFRQSAENVRGGIIIGLGSRLQVFQNRLICEITAHNEIDLALPGNGDSFGHTQKFLYKHR
jgi:type IV secretion system protein VirD4